ncbi:tyrosine phosphatase-like protein [Haematococcus lacustris]
MGNLYLATYNAALSVAWGYVLYLTVTMSFLQHQSTQELYKAVEVPLKVAQTAAVMEVVHSAVGLVRSPVAITALQVASRLWVLWGLIVPVPGPTTSGALRLALPAGLQLGSLSLATLLLAWGASEVIRYSFFACKELGSVPYPLLWLRYSGFIVLYPLGVASELTMAYLAMPTIKRTSLWAYTMPNALNIGFDYYIVCWLIIAGYLPGLPQLYSYLLGQRRKQLGAAAGKVKAT